MSRFDSLKLHSEVVRACRRQGFEAPMPIQSLVVPVVSAGADVVVESATGSGKTLAYGLPLLSREPLQTALPETLVLVPTRELAEQVATELQRTAGRLPRPVALLVGGGNMDRQRRALAEGAVIAVGTIGRIEELLQRGALRLEALRTLVLDEVDELLRGGFSANLASLLALLPAQRQTLLFSATVPTEVETVARQFTRQPQRLRLSAAREAPAQLRHRVLFTSVEDRLANLVGYLKAEKPYQALIFCGTRHETEELRTALDIEGLEAEFLHGELSPLKRRQLLERFRKGDLPLLVASDLAARGLDLPGVDLIVNYSLPEGSAAYLHRAGRTGRAGRPGVVVSLVIGQQHVRYERLKASFQFESMEISARGKLYSHPSRTQEERDRLYGREARTVYGDRRAIAPPEREERPVRPERPVRGKAGRSMKPTLGAKTDAPKPPGSKPGDLKKAGDFKPRVAKSPATRRPDPTTGSSRTGGASRSGGARPQGGRSASGRGATSKAPAAKPAGGRSGAAASPRSRRR